MPKISGERILPYEAEKLFDVVIDVEAYPKTLRFIRSVDILEQHEGQLKARVTVAFTSLKFSYDCTIDHQRPHRIDISSMDSPFEYLNASWRFEPLAPSRTRILYSLNSRFRSRVMEMTGGLIFASQLHQSIAAFEAVLRKS